MFPSGEVDTPNMGVNEEEEEDGEDEDEVEAAHTGSGDEDEKEANLSDQETENLQVHVAQLLDELEAVRELALKHEDDSLELQGECGAPLGKGIPHAEAAHPWVLGTGSQRLDYAQNGRVNLS